MPSKIVHVKSFMQMEMSRERNLKRWASSWLAGCLSLALAVISASAVPGCNHRKLPPELKYSAENVELIRKSLHMQESSGDPQQNAESQSGQSIGSGDSSSDSGEE